MPVNEIAATPPRRPRLGLLALLVLVAVLAVAGWRGWIWWQARSAQELDSRQQTQQRLAGLDERIETLRRDQRAQSQRIQDAAATNRVLRDEVLGLGQRGALLEESVAKLADSARHGAQAVRLDEVELLLNLAAQRLQIADDVDGARRAYALAAATLEGLDDPRLLNLKQAMAQERDAVDALGAGPHAAALQRLDAFTAAVAAMPERERAAQGATRPTWQKLLAPLIQVRPSQGQAAIAPADRAAGEAALQIELSLARAALERDDEAGFRAALRRVDAWLPRLWQISPARQQLHAQLTELQALRLRAQVPVLGSTLQQLRALRGAPAPPLLPPPAAPSTSTPPPTAAASTETAR